MFLIENRDLIQDCKQSVLWGSAPTPHPTGDRHSITNKTKLDNANASLLLFMFIG